MTNCRARRFAQASCIFFCPDSLGSAATVTKIVTLPSRPNFRTRGRQPSITCKENVQGPGARMFGLRSVSCCVLPILDHTNLLGCLWRRTTPAWHQTPQPANLGDDFSLYRFDPASGPLASAHSIKIHLGWNNWASMAPDDATMALNPASKEWEYTVTVPGKATRLDCAFTDGIGTWHNNEGADWHFPISELFHSADRFRSSISHSMVMTTTAHEASDSECSSARCRHQPCSQPKCGKGN